MATVVGIRRKLETDSTAAPGSMGASVDAAGLVVSVDLDNDGQRIAQLELLEADYTGLIAEFETGSATTVLDASIATAVAAHTQEDHLSATQRSYIGTAQTWPAP